MAAFGLLSQVNRRCFRRTSSQISLFLRSHSSPKPSVFHRSLCSSSSESPSPSPSQSQPNPEPTDSLQRGPNQQPIILQSVSYPVKPKDPSPTQPRDPSPPRQPPPATENNQINNGEGQQWSSEDILHFSRYLKDVPLELSPVAYPTKVAALPEDRDSAANEAKEGGEDNDEELERERRRIEVDNRIIRRVSRVQEEKLPFPRLIRVDSKKKDKVVYDLKDAIHLIKANAKRNFDETIEAHVKLTAELRRTDLKLSGSTSLPHGTGKALRIAVFAEGAAADEARAAGADVVGSQELIEGIKNGSIKVDFDRCIATPQLMSRVGKEISKILKRLTPNAKEGTVTNDISRVVRESKQNVSFKKDKSAIVHVGLGKVSFAEDALRENIGAFVNALLLAKPAGLKKSSKYAGYVSTFHLCSTMGPSYPVSIQSLSIAADRHGRLQVR